MKGKEKIELKKWMYGIAIVALLLITSLFLPIWRIQSIEVIGNHYYTDEEILKEGALALQMYPLSVDNKAATHRISALTFVDSVQIQYHFPNRLTVDVVENEPLGYINFHDSFLCIDQKGIVIEQSKNKKFELPLIEGLNFEYFAVGERLGTENEEKIEALREMMTILSKYDFTKQIDVIDISNLEEIHLYVDKLNVIIGNIRDFDKKTKWLIKVSANYSMGILDLSYIQRDGQAVLTPLD